MSSDAQDKVFGYAYDNGDLAAKLLVILFILGLIILVLL